MGPRKQSGGRADREAETKGQTMTEPLVLVPKGFSLYTLIRKNRTGRVKAMAYRSGRKGTRPSDDVLRECPARETPGPGTSKQAHKGGREEFRTQLPPRSHRTPPKPAG